MRDYTQNSLEREVLFFKRYPIHNIAFRLGIERLLINIHYAK